MKPGTNPDPALLSPDRAPSIETVAAAIDSPDPAYSAEIAAAAAAAKTALAGDRVTFVVNRNLNFTNVCAIRCLFCGYSVRPGDEGGYLLGVPEILERIESSLSLGITEVCITGGLNPAAGFGYVKGMVSAIASSFPAIHIHALSPMEIAWFADREGVPEHEILLGLRDSGLGSMPGTAAEILVDEVRARVCPGKLGTARWVFIIKEAHRLGIPTTSTMMFGHVESSRDIAEHLLILREIQRETGGFTEFVPLPFVSARTALGPQAAGFPEWRALRVHSVARLVFGALIPNIQVSWTKLGIAAARRSLHMGVSDLGGTLIEENITRLAGGRHGQYLSREALATAIREEGLAPVERDTLYTRLTPV